MLRAEVEELKQQVHSMSEKEATSTVSLTVGVPNAPYRSWGANFDRLYSPAPSIQHFLRHLKTPKFLHLRHAPSTSNQRILFPLTPPKLSRTATIAGTSKSPSPSSSTSQSCKTPTPRLCTPIWTTSLTLRRTGSPVRLSTSVHRT